MPKTALRKSVFADEFILIERCGSVFTPVIALVIDEALLVREVFRVFVRSPVELSGHFSHHSRAAAGLQAV
jgi:hypothetical protein